MHDDLVTWQAWSLRRSITRAQMSLDQHWAHYLSHGADVSRIDLDAFLQRALHLPRFPQDLLDYAAQELTTDQ